MIPPTIHWVDEDGGAVELIDQRRLPAELVTVRATTVAELCALISDLAVRGAPALGIAGAMGVALAAARGADLDAAADVLVATRPTAVNLRWGVERARASADPLAEALAVAAEDAVTNAAIAAHGAQALPAGQALTHCNAGALACGAVGTALGVLVAGHAAGRVTHVWVDETRPVLQGARLTTVELAAAQVPHTLLVDAAAGGLFAGGEVDAVVVGADRIARDGSVANKVGTYPLAVLARHHGVPFFVAAPMSTVDPHCADGSAIVVEQRPPDEVLVLGAQRLAPAETAVWNPAFDVTPPELVDGYITERGVGVASTLRSWSV